MKINEGYVEEESLEVNRRIILWESKSPYNKMVNRKTYWVVRVNLSSRGFSPFIRYVNSTTPMIFTDSLTAPNHSRALPGVSKLVFAWRVTLRSCLTFSFLYEKNDATPSLTFRMHVRVFRSWMSSSLRQTNLLHTYESIDTSGEGTRQEANQNTAFALSLSSCMVSRVQKPDNTMKWKTVQNPPEGSFEHFLLLYPRNAQLFSPVPYAISYHVTLPGINPPSYQEKRPEFENTRYCSVLTIYMMKSRMTGTPPTGSWENSSYLT